MDKKVDVHTSCYCTVTNLQTYINKDASCNTFCLYLAIHEGIDE